MAASLQEEKCLVELLSFTFWVGDGELIPSHFLFVKWRY